MLSKRKFIVYYHANLLILFIRFNFKRVEKRRILGMSEGMADKYRPLIVSHFPGRTRFKISALYKNSLLGEELEALGSLEAIIQVEINMYSRSLLVLYHPDQLPFEKLYEKLTDTVLNYQRILKEKEEALNQIATTSDLQSSTAKPVSPAEFWAHKDLFSDDYYQSAVKQISTKVGIKEDPYKRHSWHQMTPQQILSLLNTNLQQGLSSEQAEALLKQVGLNEFTEKKKKSIIKMFFEQFDGLLIKMLFGASAVSVFLGHIGDAITILSIVCVEALLGVWQNYKAEKSLDALRKYSAARTKVVREGTIQEILSNQLVPGDIISLEAGDLVPADARLLESSNLKVNEASLTGESEAVEKSCKIKYTHVVPLADQKNMIFMGTTVVRGTAKAIVVQTGMSTEIGQIAKMIDDSEPEPTPLQNDLERLGKTITYGCLGVCAGIVLSGLIGGLPFLEMLRTGVSLAIGAIPEGLTAVLTVSLAYGVQRMAKKGAIVKELPSTEILSCADVICTDKTGTLTTGQMTATDLYLLDQHYKITGEGYSSKGDFLLDNQSVNPLQNQGLKQLLTVGTLCNNSSYQHHAKQMEIIGDPTEGALWVLAAKANLSTKEFDCYTREHEIAFDSETKKMTVVCKDSSNQYSVHMKGDPNLILDRCTYILDGEQVRKITKLDQRKISKTINKMTSHALRVLGFANKELDRHLTTNEAEIEKDLIFTGLIGMIDPPRSEVREAIDRCHQAGIRVVMITGDHKKTAEAIGKEIHLLRNGGKMITGSELDQLSNQELIEQIDDIVIFARTSPHQKLRIVKAQKEKGHIVAMTGDGVNDAPAIKEADIGIAMGKNGTDVTRESSSIILVDDNFTTIVRAIEEGRGISGNIKKFMRYVLSGNLGEVIAIFTASLLGLPAPLIPGQILMINLVTEGIPALSLGMDAPSKDNMNQPPRKADQSIFDRSLLSKIVSRGFLMGISTLVAYTSTLLFTGNLVKARTMAYANLVTNQMFHVFDCRKAPVKGNKFIIPSIIIASGLLIASIYLPSMMGLFGTCPLNLLDWIGILLTAGFIGRLDYIQEKAAQLTGIKQKPEIAA